MVQTLNTTTISQRFPVSLATKIVGKAMTKPVGGRGHKAPYQTTHLRIPVPIKPDIEKLIEDYRLSVIDGLEPEKDGLLPLEDAIEMCRKMVKAKKAKIDDFSKLLTSIYNVEITKDDLL